VSDTIPEFLTPPPQHIKYVYEGNSLLPVRDTVFTWLTEEVAQVEDLYYDALGRINRVVHRDTHYPWPESYENKYYYDENGNKQVSQASDGTTPAVKEYTNKPSLYSMHPVWKLIHKDYSKNTIESAVASFTEEGLPSTLTRNYSGYYGYEGQDAGSPFSLFLGVESGNELKFSYTCSGTSK
jgi:hypothetical protein